MSYQVLARKYRPKNFETLVGQEHVVRALTHALQSGRLHHAYLFTGTRGVGKTTLSRILAKSLNCIGLDGNGGITATPCGQCDACTAIDAGRFVDYIEMDAASNRGVDEMAQLLEQAVYAPSNARFKVYMIDEVHMLTNHAFNSMLKTLEEPPEHVKFILATTDPQKIPVTVLSRCLQFNLKQMPPGHIVSHLDNILGQEGISFEQPALRLLAQGAHGSMRDALSLTDQAIAYAAGAVTLDAVQGMLGALDQSYLVRLLDALVQQDGADLLAVADEMAARSLSYNNALQDLGTLLHRIALAQTVPAAVPADLPEHADILRLAAAFDAEEVQLYYQIAVHGRNELGLAPDEYAGFSMTLLRMLAFRPGKGGAEGPPPGAAASGRPSPSSGAAVARPAAPTRAASNAVASHAAVTPPPTVVAGAAAAFARSAPSAPPATMATMPRSPAPAPAPARAPAPAPTPAPVQSAPAPGASSARAAIDAALEAARAGRGQRTGTGSALRPTPAIPAPPAAQVPPAQAAQQAQVTSPSAAPVRQAAAAVARAPAPWEDDPIAPAVASSAPAARPAIEPPVMPQSVVQQPVMPQQGAQRTSPGAERREGQTPVAQNARASSSLDGQDDNQRDHSQQDHNQQDHNQQDNSEHSADYGELPPWVTEFSDDTAAAPAASAAPASADTVPVHAAAPVRPAAGPAQPPHPYVVVPVSGLDWDGNWPAVAAVLPLRGIAQQLAVQAELIECLHDGHTTLFKLRVPIDTWRSSANVEKLAAALSERFGRKVQVETELGPAWYTASAEAQAFREACQRQAEEVVANDPFVLSMMRDFGATVVPGSITPTLSPTLSPAIAPTATITSAAG